MEMRHKLLLVQYYFADVLLCQLQKPKQLMLLQILYLTVSNIF